MISNEQFYILVGLAALLTIKWWGPTVVNCVVYFTGLLVLGLTCACMAGVWLFVLCCDAYDGIKMWYSRRTLRRKQKDRLLKRG